MSVRLFLSRAARERFVATLRQEGLGAALRRTRSFVARTLAARGRGPRLDSGYLAGFWQDMARAGAFHVGAPPVTGTRPRIAMIGDMLLPQCRKYRIEQPAELWAGIDADYDYAHYADVPRAVALMQSATRVMFYRTQNDARMEMYLYEARRLRLPVLYDLDDPLFSVSAYETYRNMTAVPAAMKARFVAAAPSYAGAMDLCDIVTVSTPGLAEHARRHSGRPVHVRRNFADRATLDAGAAARAGRTDAERPFRVAFASGSMGHEVDFGTIAEDIAGFLDAAPDRRLTILGHFDTALLPEALRARIETHAFADYPQYLAHLAAADCAVMPLADDAFNRCKSGVRVIDAAAVGVPSLVGTVGDLAALVADGETGRVLAPGASWRAALEELAADPGAARAMGRAARARLEADWTARAGRPVVDPAVVDWVRG